MLFICIICKYRKIYLLPRFNLLFLTNKPHFEGEYDVEITLLDSFFIIILGYYHKHQTKKSRYSEVFDTRRAPSLS